MDDFLKNSSKYQKQISSPKLIAIIRAIGLSVNPLKGSFTSMSSVMDDTLIQPNELTGGQFQLTNDLHHSVHNSCPSREIGHENVKSDLREIIKHTYL